VLVPDRQALAEQDVQPGAPRRPRVQPVSPLPERLALRASQVLELRLSMESLRLRAGKARQELSPFRIALNRRVQTSLRPELRACPPPGSHFPAAAEWAI